MVDEVWSVNSAEAQNDATQHDAEFNKYNSKVDLRQKPRPRRLDVDSNTWEAHCVCLYFLNMTL